MNSHGDGGKRVVFSEFGYNDNGTESGRDNVAIYLNKAFELAQEYFPWLDTIYWFRLVEPDPSTTSPENPPGFGLINLNWTWKPVAQTYKNLIIPEYPSVVVLPLIIAIIASTLVAALVYRRRRSVHSRL
jgi:hypothetical protein